MPGKDRIKGPPVETHSTFRFEPPRDTSWIVGLTGSNPGGTERIGCVATLTLAFDLLQLFIYRRLKRPRRPKDPTHTIRHLVEVMLREVATLPEPIPWTALLDSR
jgi:hypothetical protein